MAMWYEDQDFITSLPEEIKHHVSKTVPLKPHLISPHIIYTDQEIDQLEELLLSHSSSFLDLQLEVMNHPQKSLLFFRIFVKHWKEDDLPFQEGLRELYESRQPLLELFPSKQRTPLQQSWHDLLSLRIQNLSALNGSRFLAHHSDLTMNHLLNTPKLFLNLHLEHFSLDALEFLTRHLHALKRCDDEKALKILRGFQRLTLEEGVLSIALGLAQNPPENPYSLLKDLLHNFIDSRN